MTDLIKRDDALEPCPFCKEGVTSIEGKGQTWRGTGGYSDPQWYQLNHYGKLSETDDFPHCSVEFRCRTEAEAIAAWNTRALPAVDPAAIREAALQARIEELVKERDELAAALDENWVTHLEVMQAKMQRAKAVEALQAAQVYIDDLRSHEGAEGFSGSTNQAAENYHALLAELESEPLGAEFEAVWDANKGELYEP